MVKKPRLFIALCTLPALILTIVFMIVPMVNAIYLSFTSSTALSVGFNSKFVFLDNYRYMFQDKDFLQALFNTLKLMLVIPAVTIFLSLVFAFILTQGQLKEKSFYRTVFFFPSIVSMTVVGIVWSFVFNPTRGILNHMLDLFHLSTWKHAWLGEGKTALWCIGAALVWQAIGYYMVMHVASIDGISQEVYEAASIDGATGVQKFFKITIPLLRRSIGTTYILSLSGTINLSFTLSNVMTGGGPNHISEVPATLMYNNLFRKGLYGYGSAQAFFIVIECLIFTFIVNRLFKKAEQNVSAV
mgnify:FL=1